MNANEQKVQLDLNSPPFQDEFFEMEVSDLKKLLKTFKKLKSMTWKQVYTDAGLKWEEIKINPGFYTIRLSDSCRAIVVRDEQLMRFIHTRVEHDSAYGRK